MKSVRAISAVVCGIVGIIAMIGLIFFDQWTKSLAILKLKNQQPYELISEILEFRYLENRGIAFGMLQGKLLIFILVCVLFLLFAGYVFCRVPKTTYYLSLICAGFLITSGAIGNFIDRIFRGYVVDFIYISLIHFPIFNLADVYVVCGGFWLIILVIFVYKEEDFSFISLKKRG